MAQKRRSTGRGKKSTAGNSRSSNNSYNSNKTTPRKRTPAANNNSNRKTKREEINNINASENSVDNLNSNSIALNIMPFILIIFSVYILVSFFIGGIKDVGVVGRVTKNIFYGILGPVAMLVPFFMTSIAIFLKKDIKNGFFKYRLIFSVICIILYASMFHLGWKDGENTGYNLSEIIDNGINSAGGGIFGGFLAETLRRCVGNIGAWIFTVSLAVVFSTFLFGYTPVGIIKLIAKFISGYKTDTDGFERNIIVKTQDPERRFKSKTHRYKIASHANIPVKDNKNNKNAGNSRASDLSIDPFDSLRENIKSKSFKKSKNSKTAEISMGDNPFANSFTEDIENIEQNNNNNNSENANSNSSLQRSYGTPLMIPDSELFESNNNNLENDIDKLFSVIDKDVIIDIDADKDFEDFENFDPANLENIKSIPQVRDDEPDIAEDNKKSGKSDNIIKFETSKVFEEGENIPVKKEYKFPPINYLTKDTSAANVDISEELKTTAQKLIDTLASFGVKTRIYGYSRGPSITRYEIAPDAGVKVNSIVTLASDISLNLAAEVRIEAPIPGKAAIGIEVPNKIVEFVYLRNLLETPKFINAESKITIALGMDVAGNAIYSDIAKMPHLLIAGTTGSGKTICMHSIITSILYKSNPNEVKMIMIDPKKVELNMYNGIPHLLVPVVSDPKKAAGALSWAVNQMEERYMLIEEKGARDFRSYNEAIADDPLSEPLCQIVIIIDELADLMLIAKENVEQSVNRLAAKARAAGIHLIVATQRPSVDVITGLIKANIPTRIAFTVVAPQDSKTIINIGGAEKLIGRGDMLYVPTGSKPIRVQGAFVSEKDVMNVAEFWKKQSDGEYDENILSEIEQEAARCNTKGGRIQDRDEETNADDEFKKDSMLKSAIEIAIDTGRISTSLLQTKLSLGYARAARIINTMEKMNLIGPFEGSKPRKVLITRQGFIEMTMNSDDFE
ncbi:MAG: DNA translocase FtsK [Oscillospiraceae bacterium]|nr:DNA translocase FtsK [Oscillospiraceae bacterium]